MKKSLAIHYLTFLFVAMLGCGAEDPGSPSGPGAQSADDTAVEEIQHEHDCVASEGTIDKLEQPAVTSCSTGYMYCPVHGHCVPYSVSKVCSKDANREYTTTTMSSLVCSYKTSSTSNVAHTWTLTWEGGYRPTADLSGHIHYREYTCYHTLQCGMQCGQTYPWNSGWLAHRWNTPSSPHYCLDCNLQQ